ncbi:FMN-dependent NADH-azoreductase [Hyphococcus luteus]|uniref:FMN dependent NADH:quinone oxidoreductase n=1 Tax=Hyphococcus luteus TaxID=2058213 RepID=A0A2S7K8F1_9PROT|nr:NAD(P)H-dependent oxidoreductase [Marinicaulis flavus]PQA88784.1 ACP phosphodiesterase [Marinicaulis flavus]
MPTLLRLDASANTSSSLTRALADRFVDEWRALRPDDRLIRRDVGATPPPALSEAFLAAAFEKGERSADQHAVLKLSDELIGELEAADVIVIATPMYNYGMPAALKAWFDQVIRINKTFSFDLARGDRPLEPILNGKTLAVLTSSGEFGFAPGGLNESAGHLVPHIRTCAKYLGADHIRHVGIEYQEFGDARHRASKEAAFAAIPDLVAELSSRAPDDDRAEPAFAS